MQVKVLVTDFFTSISRNYQLVYPEVSMACRPTDQLQNDEELSRQQNAWHSVHVIA